MKKRVFISGVTGTMGRSGLRHLLKYHDRLNIVTLIRPSRKNKKMMKELEDLKIDIVWGDLRDYKDVKRALRGVDYILHLAALVSPQADYEVQKTWDINVGSTKNILKAIDELNLKDVKLVYIGSVAQTGDRLPPLHWGRVGDPLKPSIYDNYAVTKIAAERMVIESGLRYWVSLRQTGILHYGLLEIMDGIIFHQPLNNVLEWVSEDDSGRLLANICIKDLPDKFWKNIYNIGGGESFRKNNYEFMSMILATIGIKDIEKIFDPNWFATQNFHGQYYLDSDRLDEYLDFRKETMEDFMIRLKDNISFPVNLLKYLPNFIIKNFIMRSLAKSKNGPLAWKKTKNLNNLEAFLGRVEQRKRVRNWKEYSKSIDYGEKILLDHGYDQDKEEESLNLEDMKKLAKFRGGKCLSEKMLEGDLDSKLDWECAFNHRFKASPRLILKAGHWCDKCQPPPWNYDQIARKNPFFNQVWNK